MRLLGLTVAAVPEADTAVAAARQEEVCVGESQVDHGLAVDPRQTVELLGTLHVPDLDGPVREAGHRPPAVLHDVPALDLLRLAGICLGLITFSDLQSIPPNEDSLL